MKRIITLLLAAVLALGLTGCTLPWPLQRQEEETNEEMGTINVVNLITNVEATSFPVDHEFADKRITRFKLAEALREAARNKRTPQDGAAAGLEPGKDGYWTRTVHLEGGPSGFSAGDMWLEMTCGLTENLVRVTAHKSSQFGVCYVEGESLYTLLRHMRDKESVINEQVLERYGEVLGKAIEEIRQDALDNGQPFTGWEITRLEYLRSFVDDTDDSTVNIYAVEYVMLTDHPEKVIWKDGMVLDSQGRVENVGDMGRLATRYWWWGDKWEAAVLSRNVPADELAEAREALNENNPRN